MVQSTTTRNQGRYALPVRAVLAAVIPTALNVAPVVASQAAGIAGEFRAHSVPPVVALNVAGALGAGVGSLVGFRSGP